MGKKKSAVCLVLITLLIAVMCFFCTVSFGYDGGLHYFNSVVSLTEKDAALGGTLIDGETYVGGGYTAVYYPEGVISSKEYEDNLAGAEEDEKDEYAAKYVRHGAVYLEKETVTDGGETASEEFEQSFANTVAALKERYEALRVEGVRVDVSDDYTVRVFLPALMDAQSYTFTAFGYTGGFTIGYGSSLDSATQIMPTTKRDDTIGKYVKGASSRTGADGTSYVVIRFTKEGRAALKAATASASSDSSSTMYFKVGDNQAIGLTVSSEIDQDTLYISGSFTAETAKTTAALIDNALNGTQTDLNLTVDDMYRLHATYGDGALLFLYISFAICFAGMMAFFFVRYRTLAFAHLFTYLLFLFSMLLCIWAIPFLYIGVGTVLALMLGSVLLSVSNAMAYEYARKEYALGKTIVSSVKTGYKKCFWHIFDIHIVLTALSFIVYGIALNGLSAFAFVLGLASAFSGVCALAIGRFMWAIMMAFTKKKGAFCNFVREEVDDE